MRDYDLDKLNAAATIFARVVPRTGDWVRVSENDLAALTAGEFGEKDGYIEVRHSDGEFWVRAGPRALETFAEAADGMRALEKLTGGDPILMRNAILGFNEGWKALGRDLFGGVQNSTASTVVPTKAQQKADNLRQRRADKKRRQRRR